MGPKTHENLGKFIAEGLAQKNYDLVKLSEVDYTIKIEKNEEYVKSKLVEWEIGSLEICKGLGIEMKKWEF
jgi:hypothetical protein